MASTAYVKVTSYGYAVRWGEPGGANIITGPKDAGDCMALVTHCARTGTLRCHACYADPFSKHARDLCDHERAVVTFLHNKAA